MRTYQDICPIEIMAHFIEKNLLRATTLQRIDTTANMIVTFLAERYPPRQAQKYIKKLQRIYGIKRAIIQLHNTLGYPKNTIHHD